MLALFLNLSAAEAPKVPLSSFVKVGNLYFLSGQIPFDASTKTIIKGDIKEETRQTLKNIEAILKSQGLTMKNVIKSTVFLKNMNDFNAMNEVYREFFSDPYPARSAVGVSDLVAGVGIEIEVIAKAEKIDKTINSKVKEKAKTITKDVKQEIKKDAKDIKNKVQKKTKETTKELEEKIEKGTKSKIESLIK